MFKFWGLILLLFLMPLVLRAAEVMTNDGQTFQGKILEEQDDYVLMEMENGVQVKIEKSQIVYVQHEDDPKKVFKREYWVSGTTFGLPGGFNVVGGYYLRDFGFKASLGLWFGGLWGAQLDLSKKLVEEKSFLLNFSLVGGHAEAAGLNWTSNAWTYGGLGCDLNWGDFAFELDAVNSSNRQSIVFPFQIGYVHRFD